MSMSGIEVAQEIVDAFKEDMQLRRNQKYKFIVMGMNDTEDMVVITETGDKNESWEKFTSILLEAEKKGQCRYALYDLNLEDVPQDKKKIILLMWSSDNSPIKQKMKYSATFNYLQQKLTGSGFVKIEVHSADELELSELLVYVK